MRPCGRITSAKQCRHWRRTPPPTARSTPRRRPSAPGPDPRPALAGSRPPHRPRRTAPVRRSSGRPTVAMTRAPPRRRETVRRDGPPCAAAADQHGLPLHWPVAEDAMRGGQRRDARGRRRPSNDTGVRQRRDLILRQRHRLRRGPHRPLPLGVPDPDPPADPAGIDARPHRIHRAGAVAVRDDLLPLAGRRRPAGHRRAQLASTSEGLTPEAASRTRSSPAAGSGVGRSPTSSTCRAAPKPLVPDCPHHDPRPLRPWPFDHTCRAERRVGQRGAVVAVCLSVTPKKKTAPAARGPRAGRHGSAERSRGEARHAFAGSATCGGGRRTSGRRGLPQGRGRRPSAPAFFGPLPLSIAIVRGFMCYQHLADRRPRSAQHARSSQPGRCGRDVVGPARQPALESAAGDARGAGRSRPPRPCGHDP